MKKQQSPEPMLNLDAVPLKKKEKNKHFSLDKGIDNLVGALFDPIIVFPGGWATKDFIPEWLRNRITFDRMIELMVANKEGREPVGTDSEALAYMMPASMEAPMGHNWTQIYLHLATVVIDQEKNKVVPDDIRVDKLDEMQQQDLHRLKRWIYETKLKHRAGRRKEIRQEIKEKEKEVSPEVIQHAFDLD
ncbi:hypothetical protein ES703_98698 [subsurface metagenome]